MVPSPHCSAKPAAGHTRRRFVYGFWRDLFQLADILPQKRQNLILSLVAGGILRRIPPGQIRGGQVRMDNGGALFHQPGVENLIQGALDKGRGHLRSQVVQNQKVALQHPLHILLGLILPAELLGFKPIKKCGRRYRTPRNIPGR
jgi:hypothetical protein